jgi:hypothetical protein
MDSSRSARASSTCRPRLLTALLLLGVLLLLLLAAGPSAMAGPKALILDPTASPSWTQSIAGPAAVSDGATDVVMLKRDVILVLGTLSNAAGKTDISLSKYAGDTRQWTKVWSGPGGDNDTARKMVLSSDGKWVYICGTSVKAASNNDLYVLKRSTKTGKLAWARKYDGPAHKIDMAVAIGVDALDNVVAVAWSQNAADFDYAVVSWTKSGAARWTWRWSGGVGNDLPYDLYVEPNGKCYVTGIMATSGGVSAVGTARLSAGGAKLWTKKYRGPENLGAGGSTMTPRPGGGVYIGGVALRAASGSDALLMRYSGNGARTIVAIDTGAGGTSNDVWWDVTVTSTRAIVCAGSTTAANADGRVCIYRPDGTVVLAGTKSGPWSDIFSCVAADDFGGWYLAGTHHTAAAIEHVFVYRSSLLQLAGTWSSEWGGATDGNAPTAMAVYDTSCAVVGTMNGGATGIDQLVMMFNY